MNLKNNAIVATTFFVGYALYFYYMIVYRKISIYECLGASAMGAIIGNVIKAIFLSIGLKIKPISKNEWAIVTGCTSGLGYSLSTKLAEQGFNLILIGRNQTLLQKQTKELENFKIKVETVQHDFVNQHESLYEKLDNTIKEKYITLLINNVGIALEDLSKFTDYDLQQDLNIVQVNINSLLSMTKYVLPIMLRQKYGYIVNVGSASSLNTAPYVSTYSATKSFMTQFTTSMAQENKNTGVKFHVALPAFFVSGMTKTNASLFVPTADTIADGILRHLTQTTESIPYIMHFLQMSFVQYHWMRQYITMIVLDNLYSEKKKRLSRRSEKKSD